MGTASTKIAMIGAGAIGGVTAAFIQQAGHDIEIVCKHEPLAEKIKQTGIQITGIKGARCVTMDAVAKSSQLSEPKDLIFLATKANDCLAAARELLPRLKPTSLVVSLQNGISEYALAEVLGKDRVVGCVVGWGASQHGLGELEITSKGEFIIGNIDGRPDTRLEPIRELLSVVYPTRISANIIGELYAKLIINACINSLGVVGGVTLGKLLADRKTRAVFILLMREAMAVAAAMNIRVAPAGGGKLDYYSFFTPNRPMGRYQTPPHHSNDRLQIPPNQILEPAVHGTRSANRSRFSQWVYLRKRTPIQCAYAGKRCGQTDGAGDRRRPPEDVSGQSR